MEGTIPLGGGVPIFAGKDIVGGLGVSGAPGEEKDEACADAGIAKAAEFLKERSATLCDACPAAIRPIY